MNQTDQHREPTKSPISGQQGSESLVSKPRLKSLPSGTRTTGKDAIARSNRVRRLRIFLPVLAVSLLVAFAMTTGRDTPADALLEDFTDIANTSKDLHMANPRFAGVDEDGTPFEITAQSAVQDPDVTNVIALNSPRAVQGELENQTVVSADKGVFRSDENILELTQDVTFEREVGTDLYRFETIAAEVSIDDEVVTSDTGIGGMGPDGTAIRADKMRAYNDNGRVILEGNVSMRIFPNNAGTPEIRDN